MKRNQSSRSKKRKKSKPNPRDSIHSAGEELLAKTSSKNRKGEKKSRVKSRSFEDIEETPGDFDSDQDDLNSNQRKVKRKKSKKRAEPPPALDLGNSDEESMDKYEGRN